jgi:peptidoglycan/xylan/chitin deacetylase (PgdA/CDA1 family)
MLHFSRREFLGAVATLAASSLFPVFSEEPARISVTMDDFNWSGNAIILNPQERNEAILKSLRTAKLKAALFVAAKFIDGESNKKGTELLSQWDSAGHIIGNHTYSHWFYPSKELEEFQKDILHCESLLTPYKNFQKLFRFPFLKEGKTVEQRDSIRAFLNGHGYSNGHVTIDTSDWYIDQRLRERYQKDPKVDLNAYKDYYLEHLLDRASHYEGLAQAVLKKSVSHTILLHHNTLNGLFLSDVIAAFHAKGWKWIDAAEAFRDPVFKSEPDVIPAGESLMVALAKQAGKFDSLLRYPGEDSEYEKQKMDELGL